jgi:hypothetical protein
MKEFQFVKPETVNFIWQATVIEDVKNVEGLGFFIGGRFFWRQNSKACHEIRKHFSKNGKYARK